MPRPRSRSEDVKTAGPTTQHLSDDLKKLSGEFSTFHSEFSAFRAQVNVHLAFIKWVGVFFSGILVALIAGAVTVAWNASALNSEVRQQGSRMERIEKNSDAIIQHLERIERRQEAATVRLAPELQLPSDKR